MSLFSVLSVSASGMAAQRTRAELVVQNLANSETTRTPEGGPYRRQDAVFQSAPQTSPFAAVFQTEMGIGRQWRRSVPNRRRQERTLEKALSARASRRRQGRLRRVSQRKPLRGHGGSAERQRGLSRQCRGHDRNQGHDPAFHRPVEITRRCLKPHLTPITHALDPASSARFRPPHRRPAAPAPASSIPCFPMRSGAWSSSSRTRTSIDKFLSGEDEEVHKVALATQQADSLRSLPAGEKQGSFGVPGSDAHADVELATRMDQIKKLFESLTWKQIALARAGGRRR